MKNSQKFEQIFEQIFEQKFVKSYCCTLQIILYFQDKHYSKVKIYYKDYTIQRYAKDKGIYERTRENKDYSIIQLYNSY